MGNIVCDFEITSSTDRGKCPNHCDNRKWKFLKEPTRPQAEESWEYDQSITLTTGNIIDYKF